MNYIEEEIVSIFVAGAGIDGKGLISDLYYLIWSNLLLDDKNRVVLYVKFLLDLKKSIFYENILKFILSNNKTGIIKYLARTKVPVHIKRDIPLSDMLSKLIKTNN